MVALAEPEIEPEVTPFVGAWHSVWCGGTKKNGKECETIVSKVQGNPSLYRGVEVQCRHCGKRKVL